MSQQVVTRRVSNKDKIDLEPARNTIVAPISDITESLESEPSDISEESVQIILEESKNRSSFLLWTGVYFLIYLACLIGMAAFITLDVIRARYWFRASRASIVSWIAVGFAIGIKLIASFAGSKIRLFHIFLFAFDCILSMYAFLGIYFYSEDYQTGEYRRHFYEYMVIVPIMLASGVIGFIASTLIPSKKLRYNPVIGFALIELLTLVAIMGCMKFWTTGNITRSRYIAITIILTVFNLYFAINSYLVVNYRTVKFYESDYIWNFFCYYTDWFSHFWVDIVSNTKYMKRRRRRRAKQAKEAAKQAKKSAKERAKSEKQDSSEKSEEDKKDKKTKKNKANKKGDESSDIVQVKETQKAKMKKDKKEKKDKKPKTERSDDSDIEKGNN